MATITSAGIGSGLDIESLITKLLSVERVPITQITQKTDGLKTELSAFGKTQSALSSLRDAAAKLTNIDTYGGSQVTSSDTTAVTATAGSGAAVGNVSVAVSQLATAQTLVGPTVASSTTSLGQGSITIQLGSYGTDATGNPTFTDKADASPITVNIGAGGDQLGQVRDAINAAKAGVQASIVTDATGSRLVISGANTGAANGFKISVNDADGNSGDATGLSALAYDPVAGVSQLIQAVPAANARALLNGVEISSATNSLTEALNGINVTLLKVTSAPVTISVGQDKDAIRKAITDFTTAYNAVNALLRDQTKYDAATKTAGVLQGDSTAVGLQNSLRGIIGGQTSLGGALSRLANIGIQAGTDGNLTVDSAKLDTGLANLDGIKKLFAGVDNTAGTGGANDGFGVRIRTFIDQVLGTDGRVTNRQSGLQKEIDNNAKQQATLEDRVTLTETRLRARYTALDAEITKLNGLSSYVTQQIAASNSTSK
jgi:flagellar hook-associated protein 2